MLTPSGRSSCRRCCRSAVSASSDGRNRYRSTWGGCGARAIKGCVVSLGRTGHERRPGGALRAHLRARRPAEHPALRDTLDGRPGGLLCQPRQRRPLRLQPDPRPASRRLRGLRAPPARALLADLSALPAVHDADPPRPRAAELLLYPHGPLTWLFDHLYSWWAGVLGY